MDIFTRLLSQGTNQKKPLGQKTKSIKSWMYEEQTYFLKARFGEQRTQRSNLEFHSDSSNEVESASEPGNICEENNNSNVRYEEFLFSSKKVTKSAKCGHKEHCGDASHLSRP